MNKKIPGVKQVTVQVQLICGHGCCQGCSVAIPVTVWHLNVVSFTFWLLDSCNSNVHQELNWTIMYIVFAIVV